MQIEASCNRSADGMGRNAYNVATLVGRRDDPMYQVFARSLIENISATGMLRLIMCPLMHVWSPSRHAQLIH